MSTTRYAPRHGKAAVARALAWVGKTYPVGQCQHFTTTEVFGIGGVGDYDGNRRANAIDGWKSAKAAGGVVLAKDIDDWSTVPAGVAHYWEGGSKGDGHAATGIGGIDIITTDKTMASSTRGVVGRATVHWPHAHWGLTYLGYATVEKGYTLTDPPAQPRVVPTPPAKPAGDQRPKVYLKTVVAYARAKGAKRAALALTLSVRRMNAALKAEGVSSYAAWQHKLGYHGHDADGVPGVKSLRRLGDGRNRFQVIA